MIPAGELSTLRNPKIWRNDVDYPRGFAYKRVAYILERTVIQPDKQQQQPVINSSLLIKSETPQSDASMKEGTTNHFDNQAINHGHSKSATNILNLNKSSKI